MKSDARIWGGKRREEMDRDRFKLNNGKRSLGESERKDVGWERHIYSKTKEVVWAREVRKRGCY